MLDPLTYDAEWTSSYDVVTAGMGTPRVDFPIAGKVRLLEPVLAQMEKQPDVILQRERGGNNLYEDIHRISIPRIYYCGDPHMLHQWVGNYASAFDAVITTQVAYIDYFRGAGVENVVWMPWFSLAKKGDCLLASPNRKRTMDISFVGNFSRDFQRKRKIFFDALKDVLPADIVTHFGTGDWWETYTNSKIVINECQNADLNLRAFEAMSAGAALVTAVPPGMRDLFEENRDFIPCDEGDVGMARAAILRLLDDETGRIRIASSGQSKVVGRHLFIEHHVPKLLEFLGEAAKKKPAKSSNAETRLKLAKAIIHLILRPTSGSNANWTDMISDRASAAMRLLSQGAGTAESQILQQVLEGLLALRTPPGQIGVPTDEEAVRLAANITNFR